MKKTLSSTKIAIGFFVVMAGAYFGWGFVSGLLIESKKFAPIPPGNVNIVGVDTRAGYYIIVANQIAQLVRGNVGEFKPGEHTESEEGKKRVPIREMLQSMQGDEKALGKFVMAMNDLSDAEFPAYPILWKAEEVKKALDGDKALASKLEKDLNVKLDGTPLDQIKIATLESGIILDLPVNMTVSVGSEVRHMTARIQEQFIPRLCMTVWSKLSEKSNLTPEVIKGYFLTEAQKVLANPKERQDIRQVLEARIDQARLDALGATPKQVLESAKIIVNDDFIESAEAESYKTSDGKPMNDLVVNLSDEGRQRLWQYSKRNPNAQLLVTWQGIAIAAPRIQGELALSKVSIKQLSDPDIVNDTVAAINGAKKEGK
jgi:hypothetical protein